MLTILKNLFSRKKPWIDPQLVMWTERDLRQLLFTLKEEHGYHCPTIAAGLFHGRLTFKVYGGINDKDDDQSDTLQGALDISSYDDTTKTLA